MKMLKEYETLIDTFSDEQKKSSEKNRFIYIYTKAYLFLKQGHKIYFKNDFFGNNFLSWDLAEVELVKSGCEQILKGKGLTAEQPFTNLGVFGFANLFYLLHFTNAGRKTIKIKKDNKILFMDQIDFEHIVEGGLVRYYNLVEH